MAAGLGEASILTNLFSSFFVPRSKRIGTEQSNLFFLAGELAAPEQSYRTVSNVLARMSSVPTSSPFSQKFNKILSTQIVQSSDQDSWFLSGGAMQVGPGEMPVPPRNLYLVLVLVLILFFAFVLFRLGSFLIPNQNYQMAP